jgi:hypothetical protein
MYRIIDGFSALLSTPPDQVVAPNRVGEHRPSTPSDVPAVIVSLSIDDHRTTGLGAIARAGDMPGIPVANDVRGIAYRGVMNVEVWASSLNEASSTSRKLQDRMGEALRTRQFGFIKLQAAGLAAIEQIHEAPAIGSSFAVWKQSLSYRFAFVAERPSEPTDAGPIKHLDVEVRGNVDESMSIPPAHP